MKDLNKFIWFLTLVCHMCITNGRNIYDQKPLVQTNIYDLKPLVQTNIYDETPFIDQQSDELLKSSRKHPLQLGWPRTNLDMNMDNNFKEKSFTARSSNNPTYSHIIAGIQRTSQYLETLGNLYLPSPDLVNPDCARDLGALRQALQHPQELMAESRLWPLELVDSWGKSEDGLLVGNLKYVGFYEECLNLNVEDADYNAHFKGQYCSLAYRSSYGNTSTTMKQFLHDINLEDTLLTPSGSHLRMPYIAAWFKLPLILSYATCMPSTCTTDELVVSINRTLKDLDMEVSVAKCQTTDQQLEIGASEIFGLVFFSVLCLVLIVAAVLDIWSTYSNNQKLRQGAWRYLLAFSAVANIPKLFHLETNRKEGVISCLHGIRFLTITWVILGHQATFSITFTDNPARVPKLVEPLAMQIIANGTFSVDTFFCMSGLLLCYGMLKNLSHNKRRFNYPLYVLQRIIRLLPAMAIAACFVGTVSPLLVSGPQSWGWQEVMVEGCRAQWYWDISFASNLLMVYKGAQGMNCIPVSWYMGVDFQLFIIMPIIILPLVYWPKKGRIWLGIWTFVAFLVPAVITAAYNLWPDALQVFDADANNAYTFNIYLLPWSRASPYLVGCWAGCILYHYSGKNREDYPKFKLWQVLTGWALATCLALSVLLGMWPYNQLRTPDNVPEVSQVEAIFYGGFSRGAWAIAIVWLVVACHWGYAGPINWFLSHPSWQPFSRLTYSFYICSLPIQFALFFGYYRPPHYTVLNKIQETLLVLFLTFLFGTVLTLVAESPAMNIQKLIFTKSKSQIQDTENTETKKTASSKQQDENNDAEKIS